MKKYFYFKYKDYYIKILDSNVESAIPSVAVSVFENIDNINFNKWIKDKLDDFIFKNIIEEIEVGIVEITEAEYLREYLNTLIMGEGFNV